MTGAGMASRVGTKKLQGAALSEMGQDSSSRFIEIVRSLPMHERGCPNEHTTPWTLTFEFAPGRLANFEYAYVSLLPPICEKKRKKRQEKPRRFSVRGGRAGELGTGREEARVNSADMMYEAASMKRRLIRLLIVHLENPTRVFAMYAVMYFQHSKAAYVLVIR